LQTNKLHICSWCFSFQRMFFVILPNLPDFKENIYNCQIRTTVFPANSQIIKGFLNFLLSYLLCSQIWLNLVVDDHQFGYITKLKNKKHPAPYSHFKFTFQCPFKGRHFQTRLISSNSNF
jgi:hypothetical protein